MKRTCGVCGTAIMGVSLFNLFIHICRPDDVRSKPTMTEVEYIIPDDHSHEEPKTDLRVFAHEVLMQATSYQQISSVSGPPVSFHTEGPRHIITRDPLLPTRMEFWTVNVDCRSKST